jgi:glycylpeptide N-tetradecanoyltransferase
MTMQRTIKLYRLPEQPKTPGFRKLTEADCPQAYKLLVNVLVFMLLNNLIQNFLIFFQYLKSFQLAPIFSELEEFKHWLLPRENVVDSYVVEEKGVITDFGGFYHLPSTIIGHPQYNLLKAAYSFYNVATKTPLVDFMNDILISAKNVLYKIKLFQNY